MEQSTNPGLAAEALGDDPVRYRARVSPNRLAIHDLATERQLTYRELDRRIARRAAALAALHPAITRERVAVLGRNSVEQVVLAMACQRVGAIFVPLNWRLAVPELQRLVADCAPVLVFHDGEFAEVAAQAAPAAATVPLTDDAPTGELAVPAESAAPFALLYTSGTTGAPKGVIVTRANALFASLNFALVGEIGPDSVVMADLPMFHTIGLIAVTRTTLLMGGKLVISDRFVPERSLTALGDAALGITHYFAVPQMAATLHAHPHKPAGLSRLRAMFLGGAPLPRPLAEAWLADGVAIVNGYGMSEAGTLVHMPLDPEVIHREPGAIGLPAPMLDIRIVGGDGRDVPDGEVGELWVRGPSVTPGYWNRPAETAAAFVDGWFRTGDLVRRDTGGLLHLVDRLKDMFISGGENVYPAEVEQALLAHAGVADAAVLGVPDDRWGEAGVAFVVLRHGGTEAQDLAEHCRERLARYKCPARFIFVDSITRTASGKVQKHLLRQVISGASHG